jgi:hypothetical protein
VAPEPMRKDKLIFKLIKVYDDSKVEDSEDVKNFLGERNKIILKRVGIWDLSNKDFEQIHFKEENQLFDGFTLSFSTSYNSKVAAVGEEFKNHSDTVKSSTIEAMNAMTSQYPSKELTDLKERVLFEGYLDHCEKTIYTIDFADKKASDDKEVMKILAMTNWGDDTSLI